MCHERSERSVVVSDFHILKEFWLAWSLTAVVRVSSADGVQGNQVGEEKS